MQNVYVSVWAESGSAVGVGGEERMSGHRGKLMQVGVQVGVMNITIYDLGPDQLGKLARDLAKLAGLNVIN